MFKYLLFFLQFFINFLDETLYYLQHINITNLTWLKKIYFKKFIHFLCHFFLIEKPIAKWYSICLISKRLKVRFLLGAKGLYGGKVDAADSKSVTFIVCRFKSYYKQKFIFFVGGSSKGRMLYCDYSDMGSIPILHLKAPQLNWQSNGLRSRRLQVRFLQEAKGQWQSGLMRQF